MENPESFTGPTIAGQTVERSAESDETTDSRRQYLHASEWHEAHGQIEAAIRHALAGDAWPRAAYLIDQQADACLSCGSFDELAIWLESLPGATLDAWPRLQIVQAYLALQSGAIEQAEALVDRIQRRLLDPHAQAHLHLSSSDPARAGQDEILGHLDTVRGELALHAGRVELALELAGQAIGRLPLERSFWRSLAASCAGQALARAGQLEGAVRYFAQARVEAEQAGSLELSLRFGIQQLDSLWQMGRPQDGERLCQELIHRLLEQVGFEKPLAASLYARWARLLAETGQGDEAMAAALEALVLAGDDPASRAEAVLVLVRIYLAQGAVEAARRALYDHPEWLEELPIQVANLRIDIELSRRLVQQAERVFTELGLAPDQSLSDQPAELRRLAARLLLAQGRSRLALQRLQELHQHEPEAAGVETLVLMSLGLQAIEAHQASLDALSQALFLGAPQNWVGPFLRYGREMARLLYRAGVQDIQPEFIIQLLDRIS